MPGAMKTDVWSLVALTWGAIVGLLLFSVASVASAFDGPEPTMRVFWLYATCYVVGLVGAVMLWRGARRGAMVMVAAGLVCMVGVAALAFASDWPNGAPLALGGAGFFIAGLVSRRRAGRASPTAA